MRPAYRLIPLLALAGLAACAERTALEPQPDVALHSRANRDRLVSVMSRNMYIGADVDPVLAAIVGGDPQQMLAALQAALGQLQRTDFPTRVAAIADEIALTRPHVVGLQEVYDLDVVPAYLGLPGDPVHLRFLDALQAALAARRVHYAVAGTNTLTDVTLAGGAVHLVDHDAMLVDPARVTLAGPGTGAVFQVNLGQYLPPGAPNVVRGYIYAQALVDGVPALLIDTHLESGSGVLYDQLRYAQAYELTQVAAQAPTVILTGDLNSEPGSPAYQALAGAGLTDTWAELRPHVPGYTCCQAPDLSNRRSLLDQRIDYVWTKGLEGRSGSVQGLIVLIGAYPWALVRGALGTVWPSDHAGLLATFLVPGSLVSDCPRRIRRKRRRPGHAPRPSSFVRAAGLAADPRQLVSRHLQLREPVLHQHQVGEGTVLAPDRACEEEAAVVRRHGVVVVGFGAPEAGGREERALVAEGERGTGEDGGRDERIAAAAVEQLPPAVRPHRLRAAVARDLPPAGTDGGPRPHVDLVTPRFVRRVGEPAPVGRERRPGLVEAGIRHQRREGRVLAAGQSDVARGRGREAHQVPARVCRRHDLPHGPGEADDRVLGPGPVGHAPVDARAADPAQDPRPPLDEVDHPAVRRPRGPHVVPLEGEPRQRSVVQLLDPDVLGTPGADGQGESRAVRREGHPLVR